MLKGSQINHKQLTVLRCKLVVVGDACVGKTALTQVFQSSGSTYPKNYIMTIGAEYVVKQVPIPDTNVVVELHMYDCAGQSIFNQVEMNSKYYENCAAIAVVFDIGSRESLLSCRKWFNAVKTASTDSSTRLMGVLIGNKSDYRSSNNNTSTEAGGNNSDTFDSKVEVVSGDGQRMAEELGLAYFETSAANNTGIEEPFLQISREYAKLYGSAVNKAEEMVAAEY